MSNLEITERLWLAPRDRMPWDDVREQVRAQTNVRSVVVMTDAEVDECIDRAVEQCWPKCFKHENWKVVGIAEPPQGVQLPWAPVAMFNVYWRDMSNPYAVGTYMPFSMWEYYGDTWRWLGGEHNWLSSTNVDLMMEGVGKPFRREFEPVYCPVPIQQLLPLAHVEVAYQLAARRPGTDSQVQYQMLENQRAQTRKNMTRMRQPVRQTKLRMPTMTDVAWENWGQDSVVFHDLQ